jgi:hypothetical protein
MKRCPSDVRACLSIYKARHDNRSVSGHMLSMTKDSLPTHALVGDDEYWKLMNLSSLFDGVMKDAKTALAVPRTCVVEQCWCCGSDADRDDVG